MFRAYHVKGNIAMMKANPVSGSMSLHSLIKFLDVSTILKSLVGNFPQIYRKSRKSGLVLVDEKNADAAEILEKALPHLRSYDMPLLQKLKTHRP